MKKPNVHDSFQIMRTPFRNWRSSAVTLFFGSTFPTCDKRQFVRFSNPSRRSILFNLMKAYFDIFSPISNHNQVWNPKKKLIEKHLNFIWIFIVTIVDTDLVSLRFWGYWSFFHETIFSCNHFSEENSIVTCITGCMWRHTTFHKFQTHFYCVKRVKSNTS